jgi:hypothetical protein
MKLTLTRIKAARMQLATAIEMWFKDENHVAVHTLVCASYQVIHDLNRKKKGPPLLFDTALIKPEYRKKLVSELKSPSNFFKHADFRKNRPQIIEFETRMNESYIVFCLLGLKYLGESPSVYERAFWGWTFLHKPHFLLPEGRKIFFDSVPIDIAEEFKKLSRRQFLDTFLEGDPN